MTERKDFLILLIFFPSLNQLLQGPFVRFFSAVAQMDVLSLVNALH